MSQNSRKKRPFFPRDYLKKMRYSLGWTQKQVATKMGIDAYVYNGIENGHRGALMNAKRLKALAFAFGIPVAELIDSEIAYIDEAEAKFKGA